MNRNIGPDRKDPKGGATPAVFAFSTTALVAVALCQEFDFAVWSGILYGFVAGSLIFQTNRKLVARIVHRGGASRNLADTSLVVSLAVVIGSFLSFAATLQVFEKDVRSVQDSLQREALNRRFGDIPALEQSLKELQHMVDHPPRDNVDEDFVVARLLKDVSTKKDEFKQADSECKAELDGTGGTLRPGVGAASEDKCTRRDLLRTELIKFENELARARMVEGERIEKVARNYSQRTQEDLKPKADKLEALRRDRFEAEDKIKIETTSIDTRKSTLVGPFFSFIQGSGAGVLCFIVILAGYIIVYAVSMRLPDDGAYWSRAAIIIALKSRGLRGMRYKNEQYRDDSSRHPGKLLTSPDPNFSNSNENGSGDGASSAQRGTIFGKSWGFWNRERSDRPPGDKGLADDSPTEQSTTP